MPDDGLRHDAQYALYYVWLILGCLSGVIVVAPVLLSPEFLFSVFPICSAKAAGGECLFCGMTTAFVRIGQGDLAGAQSANSGALVVYSTLGLNFIGLMTYTMMRVIQACRSLA